MQSLGDIFISSCNKAMKKRGLFSIVEGTDRLPAHVTNVGMPMVENIEWTSCLEYQQRRISSSIAAFSFTGFKNNEIDWKKN